MAPTVDTATAAFMTKRALGRGALRVLQAAGEGQTSLDPLGADTQRRRRSRRRSVDAVSPPGQRHMYAHARLVTPSSVVNARHARAWAAVPRRVQWRLAEVPQF